MKESQTVFCPAKINLFLEVLERRSDGYHSIDTLMHSVNLCDIVRVDVCEGNGEIELTCTDPSLPCDARNLAYRAAERYLQLMEHPEVRISIDVDKKIPIAAGLAGGSADAAGVLIALHRIFGATSWEELLDVGRSLGADVPFCMTCGCARAQGIGEKLTTLPSLSPDSTVVVAKAGEGVSTKEAYALLDQNPSASVSSAAMEAALVKRDVGAVCDYLYNAFERVVPTLRPKVNFAKNAMLQMGAMGAMMSGSGPSVFGIFSDAEQAESVCEFLRDEGYTAFVCTFVQ